jgi:hypothetical protein
MKKFIFLIGILMLALSCPAQKKGKGNVKPVEIKKQDSVKYELETFDQKFENWYIMQDNPATYRTKSYYESWNRQYVSEWNQKASDPMRNPFFEPIIGYDPHVDYGFKLNHKLFYYFQYVEHVLKIPILTNGPHVILH